MASGGEYLIGEQFVEDPGEFAARMVAEAQRMWAASGWRFERRRHGVLVESARVSGPFAASGIRVMRSSGLVAADPGRLFEFLVSPEGFAALDPVSDPSDHHRPPVQVYAWREGARLELATARTSFPMMAASEFVVLNAIDPHIRTFVSKSILHPEVPGASSYYAARPDDPDPGRGARKRALNTMALRCDQTPDGRSRLLCLNYVDMDRGRLPWLFDAINRRFFPALYRRVERRLPELAG